MTPTSTTTYRLTATGPGGSRTATARVTVSPLPVVLFYAEPFVVLEGHQATLHWEVTDADSVMIDHGVGVRPASGSVTIMPSGPTTYTLTATNGAGSTVAQVTVRIGEMRVRPVRH